MTINGKIADVSLDKLSNAASSYNTKNVSQNSEFDSRFEIIDGDCEIKATSVYNFN